MDTKYCICCGEEVQFNRIKKDERVEFTCLFCGFLLAAEESTLSPYGESAPPVTHTGDKLRYVIVADDSKFTRKIIQDLMTEKKLAEEVMAFENGLELTSAFAKLIAENKPVDVAIIDINMPVMDGITAARIIRGIESQKGLPRMPIAFFSAVKADDDLRSQMESLAPANYVNKGSDPDPDKLAERVEHLLSYFMQAKH
ncbi:MAG: response regulator [Nitrospirae bacterium]|nr:response regulator [Nitrospirota bacterium]